MEGLKQVLSALAVFAALAFPFACGFDELYGSIVSVGLVVFLVAVSRSDFLAVRFAAFFVLLSTISLMAMSSDGSHYIVLPISGCLILFATYKLATYEP